MAEWIFGAATDGTDRLRYVVIDGAAEFIMLRSAIPEGEDARTMRTFYQPQAAVAV